MPQGVTGMNDWALITGASSGIGYELAKLFAADHINLALVARNVMNLERVAAELKTTYGVATRIFARDLTDEKVPGQLCEALHDVPVGFLVNNAGFGWRGTFVEADAAMTRSMMRVNMDALVQLAHLFAPPMLRRRAGRILNVASTAAFQPGPLTTIYYATKAFVFSFSVALAEELAGSGVTVTTLCPGATRTEFQARAGMERSARLLHFMKADAVARIGYRGMMAGKGIVIPGAMNKVSSMFARRLPLRFMSKIIRRINET